jgi:hypothetical protein
MSRYIIKSVPPEVVLEFFKVLGLTSLEDEREYCKDFITPKAMEDLTNLLPTLVPFVRDALLTRPHTDKTMISLLRILAENQGLTVASRYFGHSKRRFYRLVRTVSDPSIV